MFVITEFVITEFHCISRTATIVEEEFKMYVQDDSKLPQLLRSIPRVLLLGHLLDRQGLVALRHGPDGQGHHRELLVDGSNLRHRAKRRKNLLPQTFAASVPHTHG